MSITPNIVRETSRGLEIVSLTDELFSRKKLFLTKEVTAESMNSLLMQLMYLEHEEDKSPVQLYINSPGGEVDSGLAVYDYMRSMKRPLITVCSGTAASMGSILFLGADKRCILPHGKIMIHDPSYGKADFSGMKPNEIQPRLNDLRKVSGIIRDIIAERTGQSKERVARYTRKDSYFDAAEALRFGLATDIVDTTEKI